MNPFGSLGEYDPRDIDLMFLEFADAVLAEQLRQRIRERRQLAQTEGS